MNRPLIRVEGLSKTYLGAGTETRVLNGAGFELAAGESASVTGSSGAGKSTLVAMLAGLMRPDSGSIRFDGEDIASMDEAGRAALRARRIGVVLQSDNLIPFLTAAENVELAHTLAGDQNPAIPARQLLRSLGLADRVDDLPRRLSGGEAQRTALAVALANSPELLLADEVTAELDSGNADQMIEMILATSREDGLAVMIVTHSEELATRTDRRLRVANGQVVEC